MGEARLSHTVCWWLSISSRPRPRKGSLDWWHPSLERWRCVDTCTGMADVNPPKEPCQQISTMAFNMIQSRKSFRWFTCACQKWVVHPSRTRDGRTRHSNMKPVDNYGDSELEAGTAMMPPFTAICQKGLKPNSPNQAVTGRRCMCHVLGITTHTTTMLLSHNITIYIHIYIYIYYTNIIWQHMTTCIVCR